MSLLRSDIHIPAFLAIGYLAPWSITQFLYQEKQIVTLLKKSCKCCNLAQPHREKVGRSFINVAIIPRKKNFFTLNENRRFKILSRNHNRAFSVNPISSTMPETKSVHDAVISQRKKSC